MLKKPFKNSKRKISVRFWIALCALAGISAVGVYIWQSQPDEIDRLSLTYLDSLKDKDLAASPQSSYESAAEIQDYTVYGETLGLYASPYTFEERDDLYGRNILARNLETGQEYTFTFGGGADSGIDLGSLDPGVYELYAYDETYTPQRLYMKDKFSEDIVTTMRRSKRVNTVRLDADSDFLSRFGIPADRNYMYLTVTSSLPRVKIIDVLIDPSGLVSYLYGNGTEQGYSSDLITEDRASYELAIQIQMYLEEAGLRTQITRQDGEPAGYYGENGRIGQGYRAQAKVFLGLSMAEGEENRPFILSSPFTVGNLSNAMVYAMANNGLQLAEVSTLPRLNTGSGYDTLQVNEAYEQTPWSLYPQLRETGGKTTFAGTYPAAASNEMFKDSNGMYAVMLCYASTDSRESQEYFLQNREVIARSAAQGILEYFNIPDPDAQTPEPEDNSQ